MPVSAHFNVRSTNQNEILDPQAMGALAAHLTHLFNKVAKNPNDIVKRMERIVEEVIPILEKELQNATQAYSYDSKIFTPAERREDATHVYFQIRTPLMDHLDGYECEYKNNMSWPGTVLKVFYLDKSTHAEYQESMSIPDSVDRSIPPKVTYAPGILVITCAKKVPNNGSLT